MSGLIRIAAIQQTCSPNVAENLDHTCAAIETAAKQGANVICLQELFSSRYFCQTEDHRWFDLAEPIPGPTSTRLSNLAAQLKVVIVAGLFERRAPGVYHNSSITIDVDGRIADVYRKMHIPDDPHYYEKFYFTPGDLGFRVAQTHFGKIGVCICWDQWFPEAARITALKGAEVLVYPTAIGWLKEDKQVYGEAQLDAWRTMMRSHAIANGVFVVAPNRVGVEDDIEFWGASFISDPSGVLIAEASRSDEAVLVAECNLGQIDVVRTHWPFMRDRRIDNFGELQYRWIDTPQPTDARRS